MSRKPPRVLVPLAEGFEEIEAVTLIDVLRRAGVSVTVAGLVRGTVRGSHGIEIAPDAWLGDLAESDFGAIVLPGGMPGTQHLRGDARVLEWVRRIDRQSGLTAAICAAPMVLAAAGVAAGHTLTSHPSVRGELAPATVDAERRVVRSGHIFTSQGAGTAMEFALALVENLVDVETAQRLAKAMVVAGAEVD